MPQPREPGDPDELGGYRIRGRLGEGGQGVVFLAEGDGGERVAIKMLRAVPDAEEAARFRREAEVLPQVATFCTAQVLRTGTADGVPYIVSEYIDGPPLQRAVREGEPLRGRELHRLAIGTITALAAIHRAGVVHRDFKPGNVLMAADGPRVIDFGIARVVGGETTGGGPIGTPAYMSPEQFDDAGIGPPADLFAWGATMVFAASGRPPFGTDSLAAIVNRVLHQEPDLGALEGELREIAAACLDKDPAARPRASEVLLRLLGRPADLPSSDRLLAEGSAAASARGRWRRVVAVAVAVTTALALAVVAGWFATGSSGRTAPPPTLSPVAVRLSGPPAPATGTVSLPGLTATLHEDRSDPIRVTSFMYEENGKIGRPAYVRDRDSAGFQRLDEYRDPVLSPDGTLLASVYAFPEYAPGNPNEVQVTDRATGERISIPTVDTPLLVKEPQWSRDGTRILLTAYTGDQAAGAVIVDVGARRSTLVRIDSPGTGDTGYLWHPDGTAVVRGAGATRIRAYSLDGTVLRTYSDAVAAEDTDQWFSPSGRRLVARCPGKAPAACLIDTATGARQARVPLAAGSTLWGWFNEDHLLAYDDGRVSVIDQSGRPVRLLAELHVDDNPYWSLHFTTSR